MTQIITPKNNKITYLGNPKIKRAGVQIAWDEHTLQEWKKCSEDPLYFILTYAKIINVDKGLMPFEMYDFQKDLVKLLHENRKAIIRCSRQIGKSTTVIMYVLWQIIFQDHQSIAVLAHNGGQAKKTLAALKLAYEHLPFWLQQGVVEWNKGSIELENGSKVVSCSTGSQAARGGSHNIIILDEFAFVPPNIADEFFKSVFPTISSGKTTKVFIISTPNGTNHFYRYWKNAVDKKSEFVPFTAYWWQVPWKDEKWRLSEIANMGSVDAFEQEHGVEFIGAENTLISGHVLSEKIKILEPIEKHLDIKIFQRPRIDQEDSEKSDVYVITVDPTKGLNNDYHAFSVWNISHIPYKQVATFRSNTIDVMKVPNIIASAGVYYNNAYVLIESNVANEIGQILFSDLNYPNVFWTYNKKTGADRGITLTFSSGQPNARIGVELKHNIKLIGCNTLKSLIENDNLLIHDQDHFDELTTFIAKGKSYQAQEGQNDDLVITSVLFAWLTRQKAFLALTDEDARKKLIEKTAEEIANIEQPFLFHVNGKPQNTDEESYSDGKYFWQVVKTFDY